MPTVFYLNNHEETVAITAKYVPTAKDVIQQDLYSGHLVVSPNPDKASVLQFWQFMKDAKYVNNQDDIAFRINTALYTQALAENTAREPGDQVWQSLSGELKNGTATLHLNTK